MNGLSEFLVNSILEESKPSILIDMDKVKFFLGKGYSSIGRDNEDNKSSIPQGGEEDENLIALLDAMAVGKLDHFSFLDQYTRFDKYFGERGDDREGGKSRLFKLLKHELELDDKTVNTVMADYNYKDKEIEDEEYYEKYDNMAPDEEWSGPAGATKGIKYDDSEDDQDTVEDYLTANSEWLQKYKKRHNLKEQTTALFGGGFKPPTRGHLEVILKGIKQNPDITNIKILIGSKVRDGITQDQSYDIWKKYQGLIPIQSEIIKTTSPLTFYKEYLRSNPDDKTYIFIGAREDDGKDESDFTHRSNFVKRYNDNVIPIKLTTSDKISGTKSREYLSTNPEEFKNNLPDGLSSEEKDEILDILSEGFKQNMEKAKKGFKKFITALKQETQETKDVFKLLVQSVKGKKQLSKEEKKQIGDQLKDVLKVAGFTAASVLPGGVIYLMLSRIPALKKSLTPSAFINEASENKILYAFDLDDTLITSKSDIIVINPEKGTFRLTPAEYAIYEPGPDDEFDFSEFAQLINPKVIKDNFTKFSRILKKTSSIANAKTIILTARQPEVSGDLEEFLNKKDLPRVKLHAVSSSDPNEKVKVVQYYIKKRGYNKIRFYDDSLKNITAVKSIEAPGVEISTKLIKHGPLSENTSPFPKNIEENILSDVREYGDINEYKIDLKDTYPYNQSGGFFQFKDEVNNLDIVVKLKSVSEDIVEFKFYPIKDDKPLGFIRLPQPNPKIMNTIFNIFMDEVLPNNSKILIQPSDYTRYRLFRAMLNNNLDGSEYKVSTKNNPTEQSFLLVQKLNESKDPFGLIQLVNEISNDEFDYEPHIDSFNSYLIEKGENIEPLPKISFIKDDIENAEGISGKTAYYDPNQHEITLYTHSRHPKDVLRSLSHEYIHHKQNLEDRLGNITTDNTKEDDNLNKLEREAYTDGNINFREWTQTLNESEMYIFKDKKFNYPKSTPLILLETLNEINLNTSNALQVDGDLTGGKFSTDGITYSYSIKSITNPLKTPGSFYNIQFHPEDQVISTPIGDISPKGYIKILSTMYKIILDFTKTTHPEFIGISSIDGNRNYHTLYNQLSKNNTIPGYFKKSSNFPFKTENGKTGRFIILKKQTLNERRWTRSDSEVSLQDQQKYWAMYAHIFDHLRKGNVDIEDLEQQIKSDPNKSNKYKQESLNALYYFWKLIEDSEFDTEFGPHKER